MKKNNLVLTIALLILAVLGFGDKISNKLYGSNVSWKRVSEQYSVEKKEKLKVESKNKFLYFTVCWGDNVNVRDIDESFKDWDVPVEKTKSYKKFKVLRRLKNNRILQ